MVESAAGSEVAMPHSRNGSARRARLSTRNTDVGRVALPNAVVFHIGVVVFQAAVAVAILSRSDLTTTGLIAGAAFASVAALLSSPGGAVGNLALSAIQAALALT